MNDLYCIVDILNTTSWGSRSYLVFIFQCNTERDGHVCSLLAAPQVALHWCLDACSWGHEIHFRPGSVGTMLGGREPKSHRLGAVAEGGAHLNAPRDTRKKECKQNASYSHLLPQGLGGGPAPHRPGWGQWGPGGRMLTGCFNLSRSTSRTGCRWKPSFPLGLADTKGGSRASGKIQGRSQNM